MSLDSRISKYFKKKKRKTLNNINVYTEKKPMEKWFPIKDIEEEYVLLQDDYIVVAYEISQSVSNFLSELEMKRVANKNTEALSKIDLPYSFLSLVKSKDMSNYTDYITACIERESSRNRIEKETGLFKLREYVNSRVAENEFSARGYYMIFSAHMEELKEFSDRLNYIKRELNKANIVLRKLDKQEQIDLIYTYFNPDVNTDKYDINDFSTFFA